MNTTAPPLGIPPGLFPATSYDSLSLRLEPGDSVLFCTDGITDAFDCEGEQFGIERLQCLCDAGPPASPSELRGHVFAAVENFSRGREQHDDWLRPFFTLVIEFRPRHVLTKACREWARVLLFALTGPVLSSNYNRYTL